MATPAEIVAAIDTAMLSFASGSMTIEYTIDGQRVRKGIQEAREIREYYASIVQPESGGPSTQNFAMFKGAV